MGEVYRARDVKLARDVAIKILPPAFVTDGERVARLEREARLLASLSHPNIAAIYGIEMLAAQRPGDATVPALVLECVEGESLADHIAGLARSRDAAERITDALSIARQIVDALDAAHERGVIHRDLKPANVRITPDGVAKVLDFGLAKSADRGVEPDLSNSPTLAAGATVAGTILGTAAYMSPEQARARAVDRRTDVWAFGCVLYEMLTGSAAFHGETSTDVIAGILTREPDLTALPPGTPPGIRRLLTRCLEKDVKRRLRDIADARADIEEALVPATRDSSAGRPQTPVPGVRVAPWLLAGGAVAIAAAGAALFWFASARVSPAAAPVFDRMVRLVSTPAHEFGPVISPDGKWVAYLSNARGPTDVWVKFIAGGDPANLTASANVDVQATDYIGGLDVSPDGSEIAFLAQGREQGQGNSAWVIPAPLGGVPRRVLAPGNSSLHWSPDGTRIAFVRTGGPLGDALVVADRDGQNERIVVKREGARHVHWPRWSADSRSIYFNYGPQNFNIEPTQIYRVAADGGAIEPVVATLRRAAYPFLSLDGRSMVYAANPDTVDLSIWWRDMANGGVTRLTSGVGEYSHPQLSRDGRLLVGTVIDSRQSLERVPIRFDRPPAFEPMTDGYSGDIDPVWSPDGTRLVFSTSRTGNRTLWSANARMERPSPLTTGAAFDERPAYSPDGQQIAFVSDRGGQRGVWIVSADGGAPRFVGKAEVVDTISWSPDGRRLVYATLQGDAPGLMIMDVADGKSTPLKTPRGATAPSWSSGDVIAFVEPRGGTSGAFAQLITPDGRPVAASPLDGPDVQWIANGFVVWSPNGRQLAAVALPGAAAGSIWIVEPFSRTAHRKLMDLPAGLFVRGLTWAPDGSTIVVGLYRVSGDIFVAERSSR